MKNKRGLIFISSFFGLLSAIPSVIAYPYQGEGILGGMEKDLLKTIENILAYEIRLPGWGAMLRPQVVPLWSLAVVFTIVYAILYAIIIQMNIFNKPESKKAANALAIAASFFAILGTRLPTFVYKLFNMWVGLLILIAVGLTFWFLYYWVWAGAVWGRSGPYNIIRKYEENYQENKRLRNALKEENNLLEKLKKMLNILEKKGFTFQEKLSSLMDILPYLNLLLRNNSPEYGNYIKRLHSVVGNLIHLKRTMRTPNKIREYMSKLNSLKTLIEGVSKTIPQSARSRTNEQKEFLALKDVFDNYYNKFLSRLESAMRTVEDGDKKILDLLAKVDKNISAGSFDDAITKLREIQRINGQSINIIKSLEPDADQLESYSEQFDELIKKINSNLSKVTTSLKKSMKTKKNP